jgi:hypothetical protein
MASSDLLQGTLDMLVLKTLAIGPLHGYAIARRIQQVSGDVLREHGRIPEGCFGTAAPRGRRNEGGNTDERAVNRSRAIDCLCR